MFLDRRTQGSGAHRGLLFQRLSETPGCVQRSVAQSLANIGVFENRKAGIVAIELAQMEKPGILGNKSREQRWRDVSLPGIISAIQGSLRLRASGINHNAVGIEPARP